MGGTVSIQSLRWEVQQRLIFIEMRLFWWGHINRRSLVDYYGISGVQATTDLSKYKDLAPRNMIYDKSKKTYLASDEFSPILTKPSPEHLFELDPEEDSGSGEGSLLERLPPIHRNINCGVLQRVFQAAKNQKSLEILYQSMSKPDPSWRWISPHSFSHDGMRWHVRSYCFKDNTFKDFLLARILDIKNDRASIVFMEEDLDWYCFVEIRIVPHPGLSEGQKKVIEFDYGMENGQLSLNIRKALLPYFLQKYGLVEEKADPEKQQISLHNKGDLPPSFFS